MNRFRLVALLAILFATFLLFPPGGAQAGLLSPTTQWPNYQPWYQPNYYPQTPQPRAVRKKREETPKPRPTKSEETSEPKSSASSPAPDEPVESANPLARGNKAVVPAPAAATVEKSTPAAVPAGDYISFVWDDSDSLEKLAATCGLSTAELLRLNNLRRGELLDGQVLQIPKPPDGSTNASMQPDRQRAREIWRGIRGQKRIALTFDAGGEDDAATDLLKYLVEAKAPATFFITGQFAAEHGKLLKEIAASGYPIHNHSWSHPEFTTINDDKIHEELERTDWAIRDVTGKSTKPFWRPPFGDRDKRVLRSAAETGYQSVYWTLDSLDSVGEKKGPEFIVSRILNPPKSGDEPDRYLDGAIILMHVGEPGTASAVPLLIRALRQRGFELVSVDDLVTPAGARAHKP